MPSHASADGTARQRPAFPHPSARHSHALRSMWIRRLCPKNRPAHPPALHPAAFGGFGPFRLGCTPVGERIPLDLNVGLDWQGDAARSEVGSGGSPEDSVLAKNRGSFETRLAAQDASCIRRPAGQEPSAESGTADGAVASNLMGSCSISREDRKETRDTPNE